MNQGDVIYHTRANLKVYSNGSSLTAEPIFSRRISTSIQIDNQENQLLQTLINTYGAVSEDILRPNLGSEEFELEQLVRKLDSKLGTVRSRIVVSKIEVSPEKYGKLIPGLDSTLRKDDDGMNDFQLPIHIYSMLKYDARKRGKLFVVDLPDKEYMVNLDTNQYQRITNYEKKMIVRIMDNEPTSTQYLQVNVLGFSPDAESHSVATHMSRIYAKLVNIGMKGAIVMKKGKYKIKNKKVKRSKKSELKEAA